MFLTLLFFFNVLHVFLFVVIYHSSLTKLSINIHPTHSIITTWLCFVLRCEKKKATKPKTRYGSSPGVKGETTMSLASEELLGFEHAGYHDWNHWELTQMLCTVSFVRLLHASTWHCLLTKIMCSATRVQNQKSYIKLASSFNIGKHSLL